MVAFKEIVALEDKYIYQDATTLLSSDNPFSSITEEELNAVNRHLPKIALGVHFAILMQLIEHYISSKFKNADEILKIVFNHDYIKSVEVPVPEIDLIPQLCEQLHIMFLNSTFSLGKSKNRIRTKSKELAISFGAIYTQSHIAKSIVDDTLNNIKVPLENAKILDFACGTGRFYENIIQCFENKKRAILFNVYALDIDFIALFITRLKALSFLDGISFQECHTLCNHIVSKNGLRKQNPFFPDASNVSIEDFDGLTEAGFDVIVSNPPYLVLKPNKSKAGVSNTDVIQEQVTYFRTCGFYSYSIEGMLNLYQLSIERMIQMLKIDGSLGVICPSTLFGDVSVTKLRKFLLLRNEIKSIKFFAEKIPLFENVNQATNIFILQKGGTTSNIYITEENETFSVDISLVKELFPDNLEIPSIKSTEWEILRKLTSITKLKNIPSIRNRRGELDLSLCKEFITKVQTPYRLVRGNMIGDKCINDINGEYVLESFIPTRSKDYRTLDFSRKRLVCQQISNGGLRRRLRFVYCSSSDVLGNSCNYISADDETLAKLYLLLNSSLLNWRFKITSSNNHINNYELNELPIIDLEKIDARFSYSSQEELDEYIGTLYGLSQEEIKLIAI